MYFIINYHISKYDLEYLLIPLCYYSDYDIYRLLIINNTIGKVIDLSYRIVSESLALIWHKPC